MLLHSKAGSHGNNYLEKKINMARKFNVIWLYCLMQAPSATQWQRLFQFSRGKKWNWKSFWAFRGVKKESSTRIFYTFSERECLKLVSTSISPTSCRYVKQKLLNLKYFPVQWKMIMTDDSCFIVIGSFGNGRRNECWRNQDNIIILCSVSDLKVNEIRVGETSDDEGPKPFWVKLLNGGSFSSKMQNIIEIKIHNLHNFGKLIFWSKEDLWCASPLPHTLLLLRFQQIKFLCSNLSTKSNLAIR